MGSDRKSKEKKKRRSYASDSEDEKKNKRQRTAEDEERNRKGEKKEKGKEKKSHRHSKDRSDEGKKSKDKSKTKHGKGDNHMMQEIQELSKDDYFSKNNEFATWLKEEKNVFFSNLSSESAREMFLDFAKAWNRGKLESRYYEGIASGPRTAHNWKIKG